MLLLLARHSVVEPGPARVLRPWVLAVAFVLGFDPQVFGKLAGGAFSLGVATLRSLAAVVLWWLMASWLRHHVPRESTAPARKVPALPG